MGQSVSDSVWLGCRSTRIVLTVVSSIGLILLIAGWIASHLQDISGTISLSTDVLLFDLSGGVASFGMRNHLPPELRDWPANELILDVAIPLGLPALLLAILPVISLWRLRGKRWIHHFNSVLISIPIILYFVGAGLSVFYSEGLAKHIAPGVAGLLLSSLMVYVIAASVIGHSPVATKWTVAIYFILASICFLISFGVVLAVLIVMIGEREITRDDAEVVNLGLLTILPGGYFWFAGCCARDWCSAIRGEIPDPLCSRCGYNLKGTLAAGRFECPECGQKTTSPEYGAEL